LLEGDLYVCAQNFNPLSVNVVHARPEADVVCNVAPSTGKSSQMACVEGEENLL